MSDSYANYTPETTGSIASRLVRSRAATQDIQRTATITLHQIHQNPTFIKYTAHLPPVTGFRDQSHQKGHYLHAIPKIFSGCGEQVEIEIVLDTHQLDDLPCY
ncbi:hypothetical protein V495_04195 [Pseudogymnoascus sp. VKM F-4514 (FW-929)]|nr:hypothetical protein V495_04195 [Pseudogymnoascus sp. VKM F-4514 (FW-929)]KFY63443.1 hypothetical protein V497_02017 [Pseudogymnoascus sp. VKM F-4516 (FW-969)]